MPEANDAIPAGFERLTRTSPVTVPWEPLYSRLVDTRVILGLRASEQHCNHRGFVHGGVISALADAAMGYSVHATQAREDRKFQSRGAVTMHLSVDFLGVAHPGEWLEFQPRVLRIGTTVAFADCVVEADGKLVARADALFRIGD